MEAIDYGEAPLAMYTIVGADRSLTTAPRGRLNCNFFAFRQLLAGIEDRRTHEEAPSPGSPIRECTGYSTKNVNGKQAKTRKNLPSEERPDHTGKGEDSAKSAEEEWALFKSRGVRYDREDSCDDATCAYTSDTPTKDLPVDPLISRAKGNRPGTYENVHALRHTADQAAHFENENDDQV
jgi:hypothetical protein